MKTQNTKIPAHASSFFNSGIMATYTLLSIYNKQDPLYTKVAAAVSFLCAADGLYELHKEGRLGKTFGLPFFQKHLLSKRSTTTKPAEVPTEFNEFKTPRSRL